MSNKNKTALVTGAKFWNRTGNCKTTEQIRV